MGFSKEQRRIKNIHETYKKIKSVIADSDEKKLFLDYLQLCDVTNVDLTTFTNAVENGTPTNDQILDFLKSCEPNLCIGEVFVR